MNVSAKWTDRLLKPRVRNTQTSFVNALYPS